MNAAREILANGELRGGVGKTVASSSLQNSTNCPGARVMPSQVTVLILAP